MSEPNAFEDRVRRLERPREQFAAVGGASSPGARDRGDMVRHIDELLARGAAPAGRVRDVSVRDPQFDVMVPEQEELVLEFVDEISRTARERGLTPDPIRLLEMAEALYRAEAAEWEHRQSQEIDGAATGRKALRTMIAALHGVPDGQWLYRPDPLDDWGWVRVEGDEEGRGPLVLSAKAGRYEQEKTYDEHRADGTDPYGPIARHAVATQPRAVLEVARLVEILDAEIERLTALDREHARLEAWIVLNTDYKPTDPAMDPTDRLERALDRLLKRADGSR